MRKFESEKVQRQEGLMMRKVAEGYKCFICRWIVCVMVDSYKSCGGWPSLYKKCEEMAD